MGKIATRAFCNTLKAGAFSSELAKCPTKGEIENAGLKVVGTYATNQIVMEESIISPNYVIIVGNAGYIEKVEI
jgi:hypothetical protein